MLPAKRDLLTLLEFSPDEIRHLIASAASLKKQRLAADPQVLRGKSGVLIFEKPSLRTRITFETAINELGGHAINLTSEMVGLGKRESVEDVARNLERWVHLIVARTFSHRTIEQLAANSSIPVINALSDASHPCQALAFGLTMEERVGRQKARVVFVGDGNNVCRSLMILCAKLGHDFVVVSPQGYAPAGEILDACGPIAKQTGGSIALSQEPAIAVRQATVIYTDVWTSMGQESEAAKRRRDFGAYQVNEQLLASAPADVIVSHCLPAHRGEEVTSGVLDSKNSVAFDEAENRLHVQKAVIIHLFS